MIDLLVKIGLVTSKGVARRLIEQDGEYINDEKVTAIGAMVDESSFPKGIYVIRHRKKQHHRVKGE